MDEDIVATVFCREDSIVIRACTKDIRARPDGTIDIRVFTMREFIECSFEHPSDLLKLLMLSRKIRLPLQSIENIDLVCTPQPNGIIISADLNGVTWIENLQKMAQRAFYNKK